MAREDLKDVIQMLFRDMNIHRRLKIPMPVNHMLKLSISFDKNHIPKWNISSVDKPGFALD